MKKQVLEISTGILRYDGMSKVLISLIDNAPKDKVEVSVLLGKGAIPEFYEELKKRHVRYYEGPDRELDVKHYIPYLRKLFINRIFRGHVLSQDASAEQYVVFSEIRVHNYLCFTLISD